MSQALLLLFFLLQVSVMCAVHLEKEAVDHGADFLLLFVQDASTEDTWSSDQVWYFVPQLALAMRTPEPARQIMTTFSNYVTVAPGRWDLLTTTHTIGSRLKLCQAPQRLTCSSARMYART